MTMMVVVVVTMMMMMLVSGPGRLLVVVVVVVVTVSGPGGLGLRQPRQERLGDGGVTGGAVELRSPPLPPSSHRRQR